MKKLIVPALALAAAFAFSPLNSADAATMQHKDPVAQHHLVHHHKVQHKKVHHRKAYHQKAHRGTHHKKVVHHHKRAVAPKA